MRGQYAWQSLDAWPFPGHLELVIDMRKPEFRHDDGIICLGAICGLYDRLRGGFWLPRGGLKDDKAAEGVIPGAEVGSEPVGVWLFNPFRHAFTSIEGNIRSSASCSLCSEGPLTFPRAASALSTPTISRTRSGWFPIPIPVSFRIFLSAEVPYWTMTRCAAAALSLKAAPPSSEGGQPARALGACAARA